MEPLVNNKLGHSDPELRTSTTLIIQDTMQVPIILNRVP